MTDNECRSEITLQFEVTDNLPECAVLLTSQLGDGDPVVEEFDISTDQSLVSVFGSDGIHARPAIGVGGADVELTPTLGDGSAAGGFNLGDSIVVAKIRTTPLRSRSCPSTGRMVVRLSRLMTHSTSSNSIPGRWAVR